MNKLKVLVPLDDSANAARTVDILIAMKHKFSFPLTLLHVFDLERIAYRGVPWVDFAMLQTQARQGAADFLERQKEIFLREGMEVETLLKEGSSRKIICAVADSGDYDMLVIGRHTEGEFRNLLFGYVSNFVIHHVKCPLLVI
jgi:nucleotide-binding universal stress UspA family protein